VRRKSFWIMVFTVIWGWMIVYTLFSHLRYFLLMLFT